MHELMDASRDENQGGIGRGRSDQEEKRTVKQGCQSFSRSRILSIDRQAHRPKAVKKCESGKVWYRAVPLVDNAPSLRPSDFA